MSRTSIFLLGAALLLVGRVAGQPSSPVSFTPAATHSFQAEVRLPGTVESPRVSTLAGEVEGLVEELAVREGDEVTEGDVVARLRTRQLELQKESLEAELRETAVRQKLAEREFQRAQKLFDAKVLAQEELDAKAYEFESWEGRDARVKAQIARIDDNIARATVHAPFSGVVIAERTEVGQWLGKGDPLVDLMSTAELDVRVDVPERYFRRFRKGSRVGVLLEALGGRRVLATVRAAIPQANPESRTFPVLLRLPQLKARVAPGMLAEAVFAGGEPTRATIVPKDALVLQGARQIVFVISPENTVRSAPVTAGAGIGEWIAVRGPLKPGDRVVTMGNERLRPGQPVSGELREYKLP